MDTVSVRFPYLHHVSHMLIDGVHVWRLYSGHPIREKLLLTDWSILESK